MLQHALFQIEIGLWVVISLTTVTLGIFSEKSFSRLYFRPHIILKWIRLVKQNCLLCLQLHLPGTAFFII